jgi:hypothetical protein
VFEIFLGVDFADFLAMLRPFQFLPFHADVSTLLPLRKAAFAMDSAPLISEWKAEAVETPSGPAFGKTFCASYGCLQVGRAKSLVQKAVALNEMLDAHAILAFAVNPA